MTQHFTSQAPGILSIPHKSTFKLQEVSELTQVKTYVLRYWETEFLEINPIINSNGQKIYELRDVEIILLIKKLLFQDKLSIEKARLELHKYLNTSFVTPKNTEDQNPSKSHSEEIKMEDMLSDVPKSSQMETNFLKSEFLTLREKLLALRQKVTSRMDQSLKIHT